MKDVVFTNVVSKKADAKIKIVFMGGRILRRQQMNEMMLYLDENGVAHKYDDTYDVTVHCENKEDQDKIIKILNKSCKRRVNYTSDGSYIGNIMAPEAAQCPNCNFEFDESAEEWECCYCPKCGQRLSWEIEEAADGNVD